jgi:hypothetical protein
MDYDCLKTKGASVIGGSRSFGDAAEYLKRGPRQALRYSLYETLFVLSNKSTTWLC